jgi:hypothetical protein
MPKRQIFCGKQTESKALKTLLRDPKQARGDADFIMGGPDGEAIVCHLAITPY